MQHFLVAILAFAAISCCPSKPSGSTSEAVKLGWQPPWANQGQLVTILERTDLLQREGVKVDFVPFTYGGPMSEAALAGQIDIMFAGDQPI